MRKFVIIFAVIALLMSTTGGVGAAPKPPPDNNANHPAFPQMCDEGPAAPFFGWAVLNNGGSQGALPLGVVYLGGTFIEPPDFATADTIKGISMYRTTRVLDADMQQVSYLGQTRGTGNGMKGTTDLAEIEEEIARVQAKWDTTRCWVPIPGSTLNLVYPADPPQYVDEYTYIFTNYLK